MKNTILALMLSTVAFTAQAEVTVVNPGSEEGMLRQVLTDIAQGVEHEFIQANNPVTAAQHFGNNNVVTAWSSEWPGNPEMPAVSITEENLAGLIVTETFMCSREFTSLDQMSGQTVKIATWGSDTVARFITAFGQEHNINFVVVPYEGSGATAKGYVGGDADTVFTIESKEEAVLSDGKTTCFAYSKDGDLAYRFVDAILTVNGSSELTESVRNTVAVLKETNEWKDKFLGTTFVVEGDMLYTFNQSVEIFKK